MSSAFGSIDTSVSSLYALNALGNTNQNITNLQQQLATGNSINGPAANPAGYTISQGLETQVNGSAQAMSNANQAVTLMNTATGGLTNQTNIVQKIRTITVQAANGTNTAADLSSLQSTIQNLVAQVSSVSQQTQFNGINLLDGSFAGKQFQVGANQGQVISASVGDTNASQLGMYQTAASGNYAGSINGTITPSPGPGNFSGTMTITGPNGSGSISIPSGTSAINVAASVNQLSNRTGVTAQVQKPLSEGFVVSGTGNIAFSLGNGVSSNDQLNPVSISSTVSSDTVSGMATLVNTINSYSGTTGITAQTQYQPVGIPAVNTLALVLSNANGNNINIENYSGSPVLQSLISAGSSAAIGFSISSGTPNGATIESGINFSANDVFTLSGGSKLPLSQITAVGIYTASGSTENSQSFTISSGGNFTPGIVGVTGSVGSGTVSVASAGESAASIAASINQISSNTGVNAQAYTRVLLKVSGTGNIGFILGNGTSSKPVNQTRITANVTSVTASGMSNLVQTINKNTIKTGIVASIVPPSLLALTDSSGNNISLNNVGGTVSLTASNGGSGGGAYSLSMGAGGVKSATIQGVVNFQSANDVTISGGNIIGLGSAGKLISLKSINVGTQRGAGEAITIAGYAVQQLNQQSTQLGAVQQRVQSALSNEQTTNIADQSAQSVIKSANIPKVSAKLTQSQILQQAGISALAASSKTMQYYLKLIP